MGLSDNFLSRVKLSSHFIHDFKLNSLFCFFLPFNPLFLFSVMLFVLLIQVLLELKLLVILPTKNITSYDSKTHKGSFKSFKIEEITCQILFC